ncbi:MAG: hypothetical protein ACP5GX_02645 [Anaerolineae bacterium]
MADDVTAFVTVAVTPEHAQRVRLLIESLRAFGGELSESPVWVFVPQPEVMPTHDLEGEIRRLPLELPETVNNYWFASKVYACARAEALVPPETRSLIWVSFDCLILQPPTLLDLAPAFDAAVRPVHIKNVGLLTSEPLDAFWKGVYEVVGVDEMQITTETFVGQQRLRAYFNSHALAIHPGQGLFQRWFEIFEQLVTDDAFQSETCQDTLHRIFLHQAILSTLLATEIAPQRLRTLPPEYSYPYHLHTKVPPERRPAALNDLVSVAYEDCNLNPRQVEGFEIREPLRSWLAARFPPDART